LGSGAFGVVLKANHRTLATPFVVKVLHGHLARGQAAERLRLEGQAMAVLDGHPNVVRVTDYGVAAEGRPYIAMQYLEGRTLEAELADRGTLPAREALAIIEQVLAGLGEAHAHRIVHRDVKPANVFLTAGTNGARAVRLLDFGIAKVIQAGLDPRDPKPLAQATKTGSVLGSPLYFAPEQARGDLRAIDARTDLYAVGAMLFRMLVGRAPFESGADQTLLDLMRAHVEEAPVGPSTIRDDVPVVLDGIVIRALAKDPGARYQTAAEFASAIRAIPEGEIARAARRVDAGPRGTVPIDREAMRQEVSRRQREREAAELNARRTVKMPDAARAQEISRRYKEAELARPSPAAGAVLAPTQARASKEPARTGTRGRVAIAVACGLLVAALVIALLRHCAA
jgi:serine/threonine-protein kinase